MKHLKVIFLVQITVPNKIIISQKISPARQSHQKLFARLFQETLVQTENKVKVYLITW